MFLKTNKKEKRFWLKKKKRFVAYRLIQLFFVFFCFENLQIDTTSCTSPQ